MFSQFYMKLQSSYHRETCTKLYFFSFHSTTIWWGKTSINKSTNQHLLNNGVCPKITGGLYRPCSMVLRHVSKMWYCRAQKVLAFEIVSRVVSTKRVMQWNIEHEWIKAMSFVLTISKLNNVCVLHHHYHLICEIWNKSWNEECIVALTLFDSTKSPCNAP